jgi:hypothetical protein
LLFAEERLAYHTVDAYQFMKVFDMMAAIGFTNYESKQKNTVNSLLTHAPWWTQFTMGYGNHGEIVIVSLNP